MATILWLPIYGVHIGAQQMNSPCAAAMRPYVQLLWPLVIISDQQLHTNTELQTGYNITCRHVLDVVNHRGVEDRPPSLLLYTGYDYRLGQLTISHVTRTSLHQDPDAIVPLLGHLSSIINVMYTTVHYNLAAADTIIELHNNYDFNIRLYW